MPGSRDGNRLHDIRRKLHQAIEHVSRATKDLNCRCQCSNTYQDKEKAWPLQF